MNGRNPQVDLNCN